MYTRMVDVRVKPDKKDTYIETARKELMPALQKHPGFVDLIALSSEAEPERFVSLTLWKSKEDAESFHRQNAERVMGLVRPLLQQDPIFTTFNVEASTAHGIAASKAA